jgi:hypothetical protein
MHLMKRKTILCLFESFAIGERAKCGREMDAYETGRVRIEWKVSQRPIIISLKWLLQSVPKHMTSRSVREPDGVLWVPGSLWVPTRGRSTAQRASQSHEIAGH